MYLDRTLFNGHAATAADLRTLALVNYGHFTTMQVRQRGVRGLDLHLRRLDHATQALFGSELDAQVLRQRIREGVGDSDAALSLRVTVFAGAPDRARPERPMAPDVLVSTSAPRETAAAPLRLRSVVHARVLPQIKHVGMFDAFHHQRQARLHGCDDAVYVGEDGRIAEGTTWNIGFHDGDQVIWPDAPALDGITRQLLDAALRARGIHTRSMPLRVRDLSRFRSAFVLNSGTIARPVAQIDSTVFVVDPGLTAMLAACYETRPLQPI